VTLLVLTMMLLDKLLTQLSKDRLMLVKTRKEEPLKVVRITMLMLSLGVQITSIGGIILPLVLTGVQIQPLHTLQSLLLTSLPLLVERTIIL